MALPIVLYPDELLRKTSMVVPDVQRLDENIQSLIDEMHLTLDAARGVGLAAVQVGKHIRLFVTHVKGDVRRVFINPEIIETSVEEGPLEEGCLSIPGVECEVVRPLSVKVKAWDRKGKAFLLAADGLLGRVVQHECDHLNGVLFLDKIQPKRAKRLLRSYGQKAAV